MLRRGKLCPDGAAEQGGSCWWWQGRALGVAPTRPSRCDTGTWHGGHVMGEGCHHQPGVMPWLAGETWGHEAPLGCDTRQMGLGRGRKRSAGPLRE